MLSRAPLLIRLGLSKAHGRALDDWTVRRTLDRNRHGRYIHMWHVRCGGGHHVRLRRLCAGLGEALVCQPWGGSVGVAARRHLRNLCSLMRRQRGLGVLSGVVGIVANQRRWWFRLCQRVRMPCVRPGPFRGPRLATRSAIRRGLRHLACTKNKLCGVYSLCHARPLAAYLLPKCPSSDRALCASTKLHDVTSRDQVT